MKGFVFDLDRKSPDSPDISVICINKNHAKYIEDTILSVFSQKFDNFEFIIADGGSTDKSLDIIGKYPFIRVVTGQDSCREEGLIRALSAARGRYVMVTTSTDGYLSRDWFNSVFTLLESDPQVSLVYGACAAMTGEGSLGPVTYPVNFSFYETQPKGILTRLWLQNGFGKSYFPELNYCVRIDIFRKLIGPSTEFPELNDIDPILRFHFEFNRLGFISCYLPILANFGRSHENQAQFSDKNISYLRIYDDNWKNYRKELASGQVIHHQLRDSIGQPFARIEM